LTALPPPPLPAWLSEQLPFERRVVDVDGRRIHVMEQGQGRPVLLLHGNPTWGFLWRKVASALSGAPLRLVMPDLLGLGYSDRLASSAEHSIGLHSAAISGVIEALELEDLILVGQDWGGPIGLHALSRTPGRMAGLVLLNTVVGPPKPGFKPTAFHRFSRLPVLSELCFRLLGFPQRALHVAQGDRGSIDRATRRAYLHPLRGLRNNRAPLALARMVPDRLDHPSIPELARCQLFAEGFEGPKALVWGERDPVLGRLRRRVERSLPGAEVTLTRGGHFLQEEEPEAIAAAISKVSARLG